MAITGQLSYPLNSENARPFGILRAYLSCVETAAGAGDETPVEAEAALRWGSLWMKRASFQVSLSEMLDFQEGMPVRRTPFCMIQNSSASLQCCTWAEVRSMAGGAILRPTFVSPRASAPWHWAQDPRNTSCPWLTTSSVSGSGFFIFPASNGMVTSLAALARLVSSREGCLPAVQPCSKAPSTAPITPSISLCFSATLRSPPRHPPIHGRPTDSLIGSGMVCSPSQRKFSKPDPAFVTPWKLLMSLELECGGGLFLLRQVTPPARHDFPFLLRRCQRAGTGRRRCPILSRSSRRGGRQYLHCHMAAICKLATPSPLCGERYN